MQASSIFRRPSFPVSATATILCVGAAALYIRTAAPTLGGAFDSEEFQYVASTLGIAHATGYPLYLLLGKIFTTLVPLGNVAYRMNLLSALISAATVVVVYLNAMILTRRQIASVATAALFATNTAVWRQAGVASVGPLHLLIVAAIVYAMMRWHNKRAPLPVAAFLFGLGLAHHRTVFLLAPAIAILILFDDPGIVRRPREIAKNLFWLTLPLLFYLYIPIFGSNTPGYANTLQGFINEISGGEAGDFIRNTPAQIWDGIVAVSQYLLDSFGALGLLLVVVGIITRANRISRLALGTWLFLGLATLPLTAWGILYGGEPDRYLVLPFAFLIYWFAIGVSTAQNYLLNLKSKIRTLNSISSFILHPAFLQTILALMLVTFLALPFADRFRIADWSGYDRQYKQWNEIFTLPIPHNAILVGNWPQLNAMRYMQRIENRRTDLQLVGTYYDPTPQTDAAHDAFAQNRVLYLAPGIALPNGAYRYGQLGPLLEVRDAPQMNAPIAQKNIALNSALTLANDAITTALEPYAPTTSIAPARTARVALTWRAENSVTNFLVRIKLYDPDQRVIAQKDEAPVRGFYPPSQWQRGEYVTDVHNLLIPAGAPPGAYQIKMQTLDAETKKSTSDEFMLTSLNIERATNLTRDQVFVSHSLDVALDDRIQLLGQGGLEGTHHAGETIHMNLTYLVHEDIGMDMNLYLDLENSLNRIKLWQVVPIAFYPSREWQKGEILKAYYDWQLPDSIAPGEYSLSGGYLISNLQQIGKIQIAP